MKRIFKELGELDDDYDREEKGDADVEKQIEIVRQTGRGYKWEVKEENMRNGVGDSSML